MVFERPHIIAHRGASAYAPDNSIESVLLAADLGATMVEVDLQTTSDGEVVLVHDYAAVARDGNLRLIEKTTVGDTQLATLDELISACVDRDIGMYLEIKDAAASMRAPAIVRRHGVAVPVVYASFRPDWIANARVGADGRCDTAILFASRTLDPVLLARSCGATIIHPCWENESRPSGLLTPAWLHNAAAAGLGVVAWHEERENELAALSDMPLYGICTNTPDILAVLQREAALDVRARLPV